MPTEGNGDQEYRIDVSQQVLQEISKLAKLAEDTGVGPDFRSSLQQIVARLKHDPTDFGEFILRLAHLELIIHVASVYPLTVRFACHEKKRLVYIMKLFLKVG